MAESYASKALETPAAETNHKDKAAAEAGKGSKMAIERRTSNWNLANLRFALIQGCIVALIGIGSVYTTNLLTQQALASKVDTLQTLIDERNRNRDAQLKEIKDTLNEKVASREVLDLKLQPVRDELAAQRAILEQIRAYIAAKTPRAPASAPEP